MRHLIVGLGNPGKKYELTRHNAGFLVADALASALRAPEFKLKKRAHALISEVVIKERERDNCSLFSVPCSLIIAKPQTFMNLSGTAVVALLRHCEGARRPKQSPRDRHAPLRSARDDNGRLLIVSDDLDLPFGTIRLREKGGAGGHNGLTSVIEHLGAEEFPRLKIGIKPQGMDRQPGKAEEFVLKKFTADELKKLKEEIIPKAVQIIVKHIQSPLMSSPTPHQVRGRL